MLIFIMCHSFIRVFILLILLSFSLCDLRWGRCPTISNPLESLDLNKLMGKWFEQAKSKSLDYIKGECTQVDFSNLRNNNKIFSVKITSIQNNKFSTLDGTSTNIKNPFTFKLKFDLSSFWDKIFDNNFQISNTDYDNYLIIYSCNNFLFVRTEYAMVLYRNSTIDQFKFDELISSDLEDKLNIKKSSMKYTNQNETFCQVPN